MGKVGMTELRRKWSALVELARRGERIGITKGGRFVAVIGPAGERAELDESFAGMEAIRKRAKKMRGVTVKSVIEDGRMWSSKDPPLQNRRDAPPAKELDREAKKVNLLGASEGR
jgi:prevent-host-death family protein